MAILYSAHYADQSTATTPPPTELPRSPKRADPTQANATMKCSTARFDFTAQSTFTLGDTWRLFTMRSGDALSELWMSHDVNWTGTTFITVGLFDAGAAHDGDALDAALFSTIEFVDSTETRTDIFTGGHIPTTARGRPLWELLTNYGPYGEILIDPQKDWDVVATVSFQTVPVYSEITFQAIFMPGGTN